MTKIDPSRGDTQKDEENYKKVIESLPHGISIIQNNNILFINQAILRMFGYDNQNELMDKKATNLLVKQERGRMKKKCLKLSKNEIQGPLHYKTQAVKKDGSLFHIEVYITKIIFQGKQALQIVITDISEKIESKEKYQHLFENSPYFILLINEDLKIIDCNKKTEEILGYPRDELIGKNILEFELIISEKESIRERAKKILTGVTLDPHELQIRKKNGELVWIKSKPSLMTIRDKKYIHLIGQDITDSKKQERRLEINQFAIDHTALEVYWINSKGEFEYVNKAACESLGYTYEELTKMSVPDIDPVHNFNIYRDTWRNMKEKGNYVFKTKHKTKDGKVYPVRVSINYLNYQGKELNIAFAIDLTEQERAKQKLEASEEKYRSLFRNSPYAILLINMEGKVVDCNEATVELLGFQKDEIIGSSHKEISIHPENKLNRFIKRYVSLIKGEPVKPLETQLNTKNQGLVWVLIRSSLIKIGQENYIQTIIQNIDKRKKAEEELKRLNKIKSEFLKRTSHELKTPLVSIKGFANLLTESYNHRFDDKILSFITEIKKGCNRLENLIEDILNTSELKSGAISMNKSEVNLSKLIKETVDQLKGFIELRNHKLKMELHREIKIECEKKKISDVISNLLSNAIKYTPSNGVIKIQSELKDDTVIISIQDSGIGLTENEKSKIFTQFGKIERYGQGFDVISEGSGLGLYISKKIIELHGGKIWVESEGRNKGSTFYFTLPRLL
jgi:PAS domain S-box-containing protein